MNTRWNGISRRRGIVVTGAVAALLASGGIATAATSAHHDTAAHDGVTVSEAPGNPHPHHVQPGTAKELGDVTVGGTGRITGVKLSLVEVPGAAPKSLEPGDATPLPDAPIVVGGGEGTTDLSPVVTLPGHTRP
ncbi:hypothetical protein ACIQVK_53735 [Streptomyces sp. NPDC090493]|uniref:hypothetical protein n=1 Tax=Streptomyces sp. NPDC090493 TaxID=3365964 RepID=UPI0037F3A3F7